MLFGNFFGVNLKLQSCNNNAVMQIGVVNEQRPYFAHLLLIPYYRRFYNTDLTANEQHMTCQFRTLIGPSRNENQ